MSFNWIFKLCVFFIYIKSAFPACTDDSLSSIFNDVPPESISLRSTPINQFCSDSSIVAENKACCSAMVSAQSSPSLFDFEKL
jgi:hypothetical protein